MATRIVHATLVALFMLIGVPAEASSPTPSFSGQEIEQLVARIALYPDPLLAQVLAASTFPEQLADAARWADAHGDLTGEPLASAMRADQLAWDPTVQTLLPFPAVLDMLVSGRTQWSEALGKAFLAQPRDVLDAVQRLRRAAVQSGYLESNEHQVVGADPCTILPINPAHVFVPSYDARLFLANPRSTTYRPVRFASVTVGGFQPFGWDARRFDVIGSYYQAWGWGRGGIDWQTETVVINHAPWGRTWTNRARYSHSYPDLQQIPSGSAARQRDGSKALVDASRTPR
jgi:hypothetical protein